MTTGRFFFALTLLITTSCQCVELPQSLRCTPETCAATEVCGEDGRCTAPDAGCTPTTTCADSARMCGLLNTGCGEEFCGPCPMGSTCGVVQLGQCSACDPAAYDAPDPNFIDSNCDGLDGTVDGGLFVDPETGSDFSPGTRSQPLYSLAKAAELVQLTPSIHTVFIAGGVTGGLTWRAPVSLAGGYQVPDWTRSVLVSTTVRSPGTGLRLEGVPPSVTLSLLTVEATTGSAGTATIGLLLLDSPVTLQQLVVRAGDGSPGLPGADGAAGAPGANGGPGAIGTSGQLCCGSPPIPGAVGDGGVGPCGEGLPGLAPPLPSSAVRRGRLDAVLTRSQQDRCTSCPCPELMIAAYEVVNAVDADAGDPGRIGDAGLDAPSGPGGTGFLDGGQWVRLAPVAGSAGAPGTPGGGGPFGGTAIYDERLDSGILDTKSAALGSSGGGGGAPGCGGLPGQGGQQGGASIGLVIVGAAPRIENVGVIAGQGGMGGQGGRGGAGGPGGQGGPGGPRYTADCEPTGITPVSSFGLNAPGQTSTNISSFFTAGAGGPGGPGGQGGPGGAGRPGAQGPSVGVWCDRTDFTSGQVRVQATLPAIGCQ